MRKRWVTVLMGLSVAAGAHAREVGQSDICAKDYQLKGPCLEDKAIPVVGNFFSESLVNGKSSIDAGAELVYRVCNLNPDPKRRLYFVWDSAGFWSGAFEHEQLEFQACAEYRRKSKTDVSTTPEKVHVNRAQDYVNVDTVHDAPQGVASVFSFATEMNIRPLSPNLSLPSYRTKITTSRNKKNNPVQVGIVLPKNLGLCLALPRMSTDTEQEIVRTLRARGFKENEAKILKPTEIGWCFFAEQNQKRAEKHIGSHRVLYLNKPDLKEDVTFSFKSDGKAVGDLFGALFEPNAKANRFMFRYTVVTEAR